MSREKGMDELMVDYLVNEVIKYSKDGVADESALTYTDKCMSGCGVLGAAAQFMLGKGKLVLEKESRGNIDRYCVELVAPTIPNEVPWLCIPSNTASR